MSDFKYGDEHPDRPGWRWNGSNWLSPEAWVNHCVSTAAQGMAKREWKRLYYVPKRVSKGPPYSGDEDPERPGWRWEGRKFISPEAWVNNCVGKSAQHMAEREYDRTHPKQWDDRYGKSRVVNTPERKAYISEHRPARKGLVHRKLAASNHQCAYCGVSVGFGLEYISTPSFDRIDTDGGAYYRDESTQVLCHSCNGMKGDISEHKMLAMRNISELVKFNIKRYLSGEPRVFKEMEDADSSIRHRSGRVPGHSDEGALPEHSQRELFGWVAL